MPYTNNQSQKFGELVQHAVTQIKNEPNFEEDLKDAGDTESSLKTEVTKHSNEIWRSVEVSINKYNLLEETLKKREADLKREHPTTKSSASSSSTSEQENTETMEEDLTLISLKEDLSKSEKEIDSRLLVEIKERLRLFINSKIQPNYDTKLKIFEAPGLGEVIEPTQTIDTGAKASLLYMLNTMPGGSIGIAGSRGAGKSTLIHMCCGAKRIVNDIKGKKILPVLTSAPVQYESRDFILYLFSAVCQRVLDPNDTEDNLPEPPETEGFSYPSLKNPIVNNFLRVAPITLGYLGVGLIALGFSIALALALLANASANTQPAQQGSQLSAEQSASPTASPAPLSAPVPAVQRQSVFAETIKALDIKPGTLLTWGAFLVLSGLFIIVFRRGFSEKIFFPQAYEEFAAASDEQRQEWIITVDRVQLPLEKRKTIQERLSEYEKRRKEEAGLSVLQKRAKYWLKDIKFQQSFTTGWSGALKLPVGLEGSMSKAVTLAQKQMSNPEVVAAFVRFLRSVTAEYKVIIGIDELDKIESDEDAQKFLNEIKSIFGIPNCFYLISVSENAMSNFERRGLPFRDVFDSSFDNVVYVEHLNHKTAKYLLDRRIIGKPLPFIYLSYCLSGGLPRDLIRNFRNLLELNQRNANSNSQGKDLATLCQAIVDAEIIAKVRAIAATTKKIELEPEGSKFIETLVSVEHRIRQESEILSAAKELLRWRATRTLEANATDEEEAEAAKCKRLNRLSIELGSYIYFLATILRFFDNALDEAKLKEAAEYGDLDRLAKSRQLMSVNPSITVSMLNDFRKNRKWEIVTTN